MKKISVLLVFIFYSVPVMAVPGRLQGFSYSGKIKPETESFNEKPAAYNEEPLFPHYLNEDLSDARVGASQSEDKYKLIPVYSMQELYNSQNKKNADEVADDEEEDLDEEDLDEEE